MIYAGSILYDAPVQSPKLEYGFGSPFVFRARFAKCIILKMIAMVRLARILLIWTPRSSLP